MEVPRLTRFTGCVAFWVVVGSLQIGSVLAYWPANPPTLPAKGGKFIDPTWGTTVMRVTDASDGDWNGTSYSYWPTFNKDNSHILVSCT